MEIKQAIRQILADDAGVSALVGTRIYSPKMPQSTEYPAVVIRIHPGGDREPTLASKRTGPPETRFVVFSVAKGIVGGLSEEHQASRLNRAVRRALLGYQGTVTLATLSPAETLDIQGIFFEAEGDGYDDLTLTYQYGFTFLVRHSEAAPD